MATMGRLPTPVQRGDSQLAAREFNNLVDAVAALRGDRGGPNVRRTLIGNAFQTTVRIPKRPQRRRGRSAEVTTQRCIVRKVGGQAGDVDHKCSWTYDGWALGVNPDDTGAEKLFTQLQPIDGRTATGMYDPPPSGPDDPPAYAWAIWDAPEGEEPMWLLWYVPGEVMHVGPCNPCNPEP